MSQSLPPSSRWPPLSQDQPTPPLPVSLRHHTSELTQSSPMRKTASNTINVTSQFHQAHMFQIIHSPSPPGSSFGVPSGTSQGRPGQSRQGQRTSYEDTPHLLLLSTLSLGSSGDGLRPSVGLWTWPWPLSSSPLWSHLCLGDERTIRTRVGSKAIGLIAQPRVSPQRNLWSWEASREPSAGAQQGSTCREVFTL